MVFLEPLESTSYLPELRCSLLLGASWLMQRQEVRGEPRRSGCWGQVVSLCLDIRVQGCREHRGECWVSSWAPGPHCVTILNLYARPTSLTLKGSGSTSSLVSWLAGSTSDSWREGYRGQLGITVGAMEHPSAMHLLSRRTHKAHGWWFLTQARGTWPKLCSSQRVVGN